MGHLSLPELLRPRETAEILGTTEQTLANWRATGRYDLPYIKSGGRVMYSADDVRRFIESRRVTFEDPSEATGR